MTDEADLEFGDYTASHELGDEMKIPALELPRDIARNYHHAELYNPDGSVGYSWKCSRCMHTYTDPKVFEGEPCIPYKKR